MKISPVFLLLAAWLNYADRNGLFWLGILSCLFHECGHLAVLFLLKKPVKSICVTVHGAAIVLGHDMSYKEEWCVAAAGPAVNFGLAVAFSRISGMEAAAGMNLALAVFNLLPVQSLDGGRILRCAFGILFDPGTGDWAAERISEIMTVMVCFAGAAAWILRGNITLLLATAWLIKGKKEKGTENRRKSRK